MTKTEKNAMIDDLTDRSIVAAAAKEDLGNAVVRAVLSGVSWAEIGATLNLSKQTAYNRYNTHVETYKRFAAGTSTLTAEDEQNMLDNLWNPEPYTGFLHVRNRQWKREPVMARYSCSCGWNVVYPEHEAGDAFDDIAEHEETAHEGIPQEENYGNEDDAAAPEEAAKKIDAPAPAKAKKAAKKIDAPAPAKVEDPIHQGITDTSGDVIDWTGRRQFKNPAKCPFCEQRSHYARRPQHWWIYPSCTLTAADYATKDANA